MLVIAMCDRGTLQDLLEYFGWELRRLVLGDGTRTVHGGPPDHYPSLERLCGLKAM